MNAVTMDHLSKTYPGGKQAVNSVTLNLAPGEVFGFLGPNGAGKTTTVKLLNGMLTPSSGCCRVFDLNPAEAPQQVHALTGVVTEHAQMYDNLTGLENLVFYGALFGLDAAVSRRRGQKLLEQLKLSDAGDRKLSTYSTGMRQRLSLARALIHEPKILFLDEPTSGLDPESAQKVHRMIRQLAAEQGCTVFLCTHQLRYAQEICTRYGLMDQGQLLAEGTLDALRSRIGGRMTMKVAASGLPAGLLEKAGITSSAYAESDGVSRPDSSVYVESVGASGLDSSVYAESVGASGPDSSVYAESVGASGPNSLARAVSYGEHIFEIPIHSENEIPRLVRQIVEAGEDIYQVSAELPTLEDIYFALTSQC